MWLPSIRTTIAVVLVAVIAAGVLLARSGASDHESAAVSRSDAPVNEAPHADSTPRSTNVASPPASSLPASLSSTYERVRGAVTRGTHRLVLERKSAFPVVSKSAAALRARTSCWSLDRDEKLLKLHVYRGMTLGDLAIHFDTTVHTLRRANPTLHGSTLLAGNAYAIPIDHLQVIHHVVKHGETMGELGRMVDAPTSYSIRAWNCLDSNQVRTGDTLVLFKHAGPVTPAASER